MLNRRQQPVPPHVNHHANRLVWSAALFVLVSALVRTQPCVSSKRRTNSLVHSTVLSSHALLNRMFETESLVEFENGEPEQSGRLNTNTKKERQD